MKTKCIKIIERRPFGRAYGFSLIELMIAMTLGIILIAGMITVFSGNRRSAELNGEMANMQENARFAINAISSDVRMGGFQGCPDINSTAANIIATNPPTTGTNIYRSATSGSVVTTPDIWSPPQHPTFVTPPNNPPIPGTHTLTLQYGGPDVANLVTPLANPNAPVTVQGNPWNATVGDLLLISNCNVADIFRVTAMTINGQNTVFQHNAGANGNVQQTLRAAYGANGSTALVMEFNSEVYYVGDTGLENDNGDMITALYRQSHPYNGQPVELIQGVENLRVRFGVRSNSGQLRYVLPNAVGLDPGRIESIQIGLLMTSYDHISNSDDNQTYILAGQPIPPTNQGVADGTNHAEDRRFRLAFNTTVQVRNRRPR